MKCVPLSFRSAKELRARAEILPRGPQWVSEILTSDHPVKQPIRLFYRNAVECLQALLSHPLFEPHISFVPRKVWTSAAKICRIYDEWLSGDRAWKMQVRLLVLHQSVRVIIQVTSGIITRRIHSPGGGIVVRQDQHFRYERQSHGASAVNQPCEYRRTYPLQDLTPCVLSPRLTPYRQVHAQNDSRLQSSPRSSSAPGAQHRLSSSQDCGGSRGYDE